MSKQLEIFKESYVDRLYASVQNGESLALYQLPTFEIDAGTTLPSQIVVANDVPILGVSPSDDTESSIKIFEFLGPLTSTQASDKRLWTYLAHVTFREYTMSRWKIDATDEAKAKASILEHWFVSENDRRLRRHALARLWWAANLTVAPWESDAANFVSLKDDDRYLYTRALLNKQDIFLNILERSMGRSKKVLIALLEIFRKNTALANDREAVRGLIKEANLILGYRKLSYLPYATVYEILNNLAIEFE